MKSLGIMGGTFNPIHMGHLIAAQEAMVAFNLDQVVFVPNRTPPHRMGEPDIISGEDRYMMVSMAVTPHEKFFTSRIELDRPEISYTLETIRELQMLNQETAINFIAGMDSLVEYEWYHLDELLGMLTRFIVVARPGFQREELQERIRRLGLAHGDKVQTLVIPDIHISSTLIRKRIKEDKPITFLVPSLVEAFIRKHHLYR